MMRCKIMGLGVVTIHQVANQKSLNEMSSSLRKASILTPQAVLYISDSFRVHATGELFLSNGECIPLFTGGVLNNARESIKASFALQDAEYVPQDFALAQIENL